jgi:hypothetical protein
MSIKRSLEDWAQSVLVLLVKSSMDADAIVRIQAEIHGMLHRLPQLLEEDELKAKRMQFARLKYLYERLRHDNYKKNCREARFIG